MSLRGRGNSVLFDNFDTHGIVAHLRDGRVIAWSELGRSITFDTDREYDSWFQRVPDLKQIEHVINVQFDWGMPRGAKTTIMSGKQYKIMVYGEAGKRLYGNVVGMTLLGGAENISGGTLLAAAVGTSVWAKIIAVGPP